MIVIPQELSWIVNYSTENVASAIDESSFPQSPVPYDKTIEEETVEINPADYEETEPPVIEEKAYNADSIVEDAEALQAYRDSVDFVENKIVFSVLDYREKGAKAEYLKDSSELCRKYKLNKVELILDVKTDKAEKKAGLTAYQVFYSATVKTDDIWAVVDEMAKEDGIMSAEPDFIWESAAEDDMQEVTPEELEFSNWSEHGINVSEAWDSLTEGSSPGEGVVVAVIDTGVDYTHNDLKSNMWTNPGEIAGNGADDDGNGYIDDVHGINLIDPNRQGDPMDDHGHGTHVSGIIAMSPGNGGGVGIAYGAKIMAVKAGQSNGSFASTDIAKAIQYASSNGADVINMSFGGTGKSILVEAALEDAFGTCALIAAAGNDGIPTNDAYPIYFPTEDIYPAGYSYVLGVMASSGDSLASFSNWDFLEYVNCEYEMAAPGVEITSTLPGNRYAKWSGTSMAAPVVSAAAAIIRREKMDKNKYSSRYIMGQLVSATNDVVYGKTRAYRKLNILSSLMQSPVPKPSVSKVYLFDNEEISDANNNDGIVQAGETVDLGLMIRNHFGIAKDVNVTVDAKSPAGIDNPYIEFITDNIALPDEIGSFATVNNGFVFEDDELIGVNNPLRIKVKDEAPNDLAVTLKITVSAKNGMDDSDTDSYEAIFYYTFNVQRGVYLRGIISEDMTLTNDKLWILDKSVRIPSDKTVTIEAGTTVQFWSADNNNPYSNTDEVFVQVDGSLISNGTETAPVEMILGKQYEDKGILLKGYGNIELNYTILQNPYQHNVSATNREDKCRATKLNHCKILQTTERGLEAYDTYDWVFFGRLDAGSVNDTIFTNLFTQNNVWWPNDAISLSQAERCLFDNCNVTYKLSNLTNSVFLLNKSAYESTSYPNISFGNYSSTNISNSAILNNLLDFTTSSWMSIWYVNDSGQSDLSNNYWGTDNSNLVKRQVRDADSDVSMGDIIQEPYLTLESDMSSIYPFVTEAFITDESGANRLNDVIGSQTVQVHVKFNRDMAQEEAFEPMVTFGPAEPYTDYVVQGDWANAREWVGTIKIDPFINQGTEYIRIKNAAAADDHWLETGTDTARFSFEISKSTAEALALQGNGGSNCNYLNWVQDDYDTLAGFNLYRSTSYDKNTDLSEQDFEKINPSIISNDVYEYTDYEVEQGMDYYYYFTVVDTAFNESEPSNVVMCTPLDEEAPVITHNAVTAGTKGRQLNIDAVLTDNVGVTSAILRYRVSGSSSWQSAYMKLVTGDLYRGSISAYETNVDSVEYYLEASDGTNTSYNGRETAPYVISMSDEIFAESIELSDQAISIAPGGTRKITANIKPVDATNTNVTWTSSNEKIATVDNEGNITGIKTGSAEITATASNGVSAICTVTVELQTDTTVYADAVTTSKGDSVNVPVMIRSNSGISSMRLRFSYDPEQLTPTTITKGDLLKSAYVTGSSSEPGTYYALFTNARNISEDGLLYTITFDVARSAPDSGVDISLSYEPGDVSNASHEDVQITAETIHIGFEDAVLGDVYEDGKINSHDMTSMQQYLTELMTFTKHQKFLADLTEDDKVNMQDMVALAQKYLNPTRGSGLSGLMSILGLGVNKLEGSIGSAELGDDMKVAIPVTFTASPDIAAYKFAINYNGELYKLESIDSEGTDNGSFMTNVDDAGVGRAVVTWYGNENTDVCTHTMTLNFVAVADDISEETTVTMSYGDGDICDLSGTSYEAEITAGTIYPNGQGVYDEPVFTWDGHTAASAYFRCLTDETKSKAVDAEITKEVIKEATATETGEARYTATVTFLGKNYTDVKVVETQYGVTEEEWQEAQEALSQALAEKDAALEAKAAAEASFAQAQTDLTTAQATIATLNQTIESKDATIAEKEAALTAANAALETANANLTKATNDLAAANEQLAAANDRIANLEQAMDGSNEDLVQALEDLSAAQRDLEATQTALETATANYNSTKTQLDAANETIASLNAQLTDKEAALQQALADKEAAIEAKNAAQESLAAAQADLVTAQTTIATLNQTIESKDATIAEKEAALADANAALETANANLTKATSDLAAANEQLALATARIADLEAALDGNEDLAQALEDLNAARSELAATQTALETATANYNSTKTQLDAAVLEIADLRTQLQTAIEDKEKAEAELAAAKEDKEAAVAAAEAANQRVEELTQAKAELEEQLANAGTASAEVQAELDRVNAELAAAEQEKTAAVKDKEAAEARAAAAEAEVERLKALINASDISKATISGLSDKTYTGSSIKPAITVTTDGKTLAEGKDFSVYYVNNIEVGEATVIVTGEGDYNGVCKASFMINKASIDDAVISGVGDAVFKGKAITPAVTVTLGDRILANTDYTVSYSDNIQVGTATITITGEGNYEGTCTTTFRINKANNTLAASTKKVTAKASKLKKKKQTIAATKAFVVSKAQGAVTYKKISGKSKITIAPTGKITLKKGLKKGTYKVKVQVTAAGTASYKAGSKIVTLSIKVK